MKDTTSGREFLVTILPHQAIADRDLLTIEKSPAPRKYFRLEDTFSHTTATPSAAGPVHFHAPTLRWACERADLVLIEAGWLGPDSEQDFGVAVDLSSFILLVRTFPQRADKWARALRPWLNIDAPIYSAIMPIKVTDDPPEASEFKEGFHLTFLGARQ